MYAFTLIILILGYSFMKQSPLIRVKLGADALLAVIGVIAGLMDYFEYYMIIPALMIFAGFALISLNSFVKDLYNEDFRLSDILAILSGFVLICAGTAFSII